MTEQFAQRNINSPEGSISVTADTDLTPSDVGKFIRCSLLAPSTVTMPKVNESGDGAEITIVAVNGATNALTIAPAAGDALIATPAGAANPAITNNASFILRADGLGTWYIVAALA